MREVEKEIRQRIIETEQLIELRKKDREVQKYYEGQRAGLMTALSIMKQFGGEE